MFHLFQIINDSSIDRMHQISIFYSDDDQDREEDEDYGGLYQFITSTKNKKIHPQRGKTAEPISTKKIISPQYIEESEQQEVGDDKSQLPQIRDSLHFENEDQSQTQPQIQPTQLQQRPPKGKIVISHHQFYKMYFEFCLFASKMFCSSQITANPYYKYVYDSIVEDLKYRQTLNTNRSNFRSKIRTFIIKKILQQFISKMRQEQYGNQVIVVEERGSKRLSKGDRQYFNKQKIRNPPCQISMNYISKLFESEKLRELYLDYLSSGKMKTCILRKNYEQVREFCQKIERIGQEKCSFKDKKEYFQLLKKPMSMNEIEEYLSEAQKIGQKFCDMASGPIIELN